MTTNTSKTDYTFQIPFCKVPFTLPFATDDEAFEYAMACDDTGATTSVGKVVDGVMAWWHAETQSWKTEDSLRSWYKDLAAVREYRFFAFSPKGTRFEFPIVAKSEWEARDKARALCASSGFSLVELDTQNDF